MHHFGQEAVMSEKPSENEDEYFIRMECEKKRALEKEKHSKLGEKERDKLKELH